MSRQSVKEQVVAYLNASGIDGCGTVYNYAPKITPEGAFYAGQPIGNAQGAVVYTHIERQLEKRIAFGGGPTISTPDTTPSGRKLVTYSFVFSCHFKSAQNEAEVAGLGNDEFLDSFVQAIRANRTANSPYNTPGTVWQWGEGGENGGPDIQIESDLPVLLNKNQQDTYTFSTIRVTVLEEVDS